MIDILRNDIRFPGVIISDDIGMKAITNNYSTEEAPVLALSAGCDIVLYCNELDAPPIALKEVKGAIANGRLNEDAIQDSINRVLKVKEKYLP